VPASPPGAIGGALIKAGRRSAGLSRRQLAREMTVSPAAVRSWENGNSPLFCMSYDQLRRLAAALDQGHAPASSDLDELLLASQCDLLVTGMLRGFEDYAEVGLA
jgi:transcriptional regulator with XRE-family HTH domain